MEHSSVTLLQLFEHFDTAALVEGSTKMKCRTAIRKAAAILGDVTAGAVDVPMAGRYQLAMRDSGMSPASVRSYIGCVSQVYLWGVENKILASNPFAEAKKIRVPKRDVQTFEPDEVDDLKSAAAEMWNQDPTAQIRWFFLIEVAATSGLRSGELQNLRREDLDLEAGTIRVQYRPDKTSEHWQWGTKGKTDRVVPFSQEALETAYRLVEVAKWRYPVLKECACRRLQGMIGQIPEHVRKQPYQDFYIDLRQIRALANIRRRDRKLGAVKNGSIHLLRKTAVSNWARAGVPMADAQYVAGHRSMMTTREYYIAVDHARAVAAVRAAM
jgi:integrase